MKALNAVLFLFLLVNEILVGESVRIRHTCTFLLLRLACCLHWYDLRKDYSYQSSSLNSFILIECNLWRLELTHLCRLFFITLEAVLVFADSVRNLQIKFCSSCVADIDDFCL